jgi:ankyrin repeat protein
MSIEVFMKAVQSGEAAVVSDLLSKDPSMASVRDSSGVSALMNALYRRHREVATAIRKAHPELDIFEAASVGDEKRLRKLLSDDPGLAKAWSGDGFTALHFACFFGQEGAAKLLLQAGSDVKAVAKNPMQVMPLHSAATSRSVGIVRELLEHGAPVNAKQQQGWTALHAAAQNGDHEMYELLVARGADPETANDTGVTASDLMKKAGV